MTKGRLAPAIFLLRSALASNLELDAPLAAAQVRCLARILLDTNKDPLARSEFTAARTAWKDGGGRLEQIYRQHQLMQVLKAQRNQDRRSRPL